MNWILASLAVLVLAACGAGVVDAPTQTTQGAEALSSGQICGGIAALPCPDGQRCLIHESYPDATGICVGRDEYRRHQNDCALVRCAAVECPVGYRRHFTPSNCCGTCIPDGGPSSGGGDGTCRSAADCQDLVHIMCVGEWACVGGACAYSCTVYEIQ